MSQRNKPKYQMYPATVLLVNVNCDVNGVKSMAVSALVPLTVGVATVIGRLDPLRRVVRALIDC